MSPQLKYRPGFFAHISIYDSRCQQQMSCNGLHPSHTHLFVRINLLHLSIFIVPHFYALMHKKAMQFTVTGWSSKLIVEVCVKITLGLLDLIRL